MFRLPVCPHCGTIYRYKDTKKAIKNKENTCYHCNKRFRAKVIPGILVGAAVPIILNILINILILSSMKEAQLLPMTVITLIFLLIIFLIIPFFTGFVKVEEEAKDISKRRNKRG